MGEKRGKGVLELQCQHVTTPAPATPRVSQVTLQFGLPRASVATGPIDPIRLSLGPGRIVALIGPSGSGKSVTMRQIEAARPGACNVQRVSFAPGRPIVEAVLAAGTLADTLSILSTCGLGEARLWIRHYRELSDGERFRARLAKAVGHCSGSAGESLLLCDEFCSGLHRRVAKAISYNLRKLVTQRGLCLVVATSGDDVLTDLQPDATVCLSDDGTHRMVEAVPVRRAISFARRLHIQPGCKRDYEAFKPMHYRQADELGFVDRVFVMREGVGGPPVGIVVYSHGPLELALRNQATGGRFIREPALLNRELRILRRLVIHPDLRGCGLGHRLVAQTLPLVGTRYVECLASMGAVNPVFEKAGMERIGECRPGKEQVRALAALAEAGVDPFGRDFVLQVCRRPRVRRIVARLVFHWYRATTGRGQRRVARQSPQLLAQTFRGLIGSSPVYYLWCRDEQ